MKKRSIASRTGNIARLLAVAAGLILGLLPLKALAAFGDCSAGGYLGAIDERVEATAVDCREVARFTIETPKGSREVRIVRTTDLPTVDLPVMVREIRRGVERAAAALPSVGTLAPADITIWISHLLPEPDAGEDAEAFDLDGQTVGAEDGCRMAVYPGITGRRGLAFTTAHEFFHCVQREEYSDKYARSASTWWVEGSAEWFANLALPGTDSSDGYVAGFDAVSSDTALTAMSYESVVFFFWLADEQGNNAIERVMDAMPNASGETAQQDALAGLFAPEDWQRFAEAYLDQDLRQPGGRALASSPFPGDIYVWEGDRTHTLSAERFVLARAQLEFSCGAWSVSQEEKHGTRSFKEGSGAWEELPERIVADEGTRRFRMAGFASEPEGFSVTIEGKKDLCRGCPATSEAGGSLDQCLIGEWELVSGGYGRQIENNLRGTGIFESLDYPDLHRYLTLSPNGRYRQAPSPEGEEGEASLRSEEGELWQGFSKLKLETGGYWSTNGDVLELCEEQKTVDIDLTIIDPDGDSSRIDDSREEDLPPLKRQRDYECSGASLSLVEALPGAPTITWEYQRR